MIFSLLLACAGTDPTDTAISGCEVQPPQVERLHAPTGYRAIETAVEATWLSEPRTVPVGIWYATDATEGEPALYMGAVVDEDSWVDAPFSDPAPGCLLPLVVYSHGSQAWGGNASPLLRHLVAQGWVAAAPDHVDNLLFDNVDPKPATFPLTRAADIRATIDAIEALPEGDPLAGRVDTSRVLVMGHSFGGQTASLLAGPEFDAEAIDARCASAAEGCTEAERAAFDSRIDDPRVVAVMPLDGFASTELVSAAGWAAADRPILYLARSQEGDEEQFLTASAAEITWARFEGACHETFTSTEVVCETFDKEEGLDDTAAYLTAFAATQVLGLEEAPYTGILDGSTVVDERVTVRRSGD